MAFEIAHDLRPLPRVTGYRLADVKGVEKPVELTGTINDPITDPYGRERIALKLDTTVDRTEFGVNWNVPLPDGKPALADEVKLAAELYFVREA